MITKESLHLLTVVIKYPYAKFQSNKTTERVNEIGTLRKKKKILSRNGNVTKKIQQFFLMEFV